MIHANSSSSIKFSSMHPEHARATPNLSPRLIWTTTAVLFLLVALLLPVPVMSQGTPTARQRDEPLSSIERLERGRYCVESAGADLYQTGSNSFTLARRGVPVAAHLFWSGRYAMNQPGQASDEEISANGDATLILNLENGTHVQADADLAFYQHRQEVSEETEKDLIYYSYHRTLPELVGEDSPLNGTEGGLSVTILDLKTEANRDGAGHGAGLLVVYEHESCPLSQVDIQFGLDTFYVAREHPRGPNSDVSCVDFAQDERMTREMAVHMFVGGVEAAPALRPNNIYHATGSGEHPADLISSDLRQRTPYEHDPINRPYPLINDDGEFDNFRSEIAVVAGSTHACFQMESFNEVVDEEKRQGVSAAWIGLATQLPLPAIETSKVADAKEVPAGKPIGFTIWVTSTGEATAHDVVSTDALPTHAGFSWSIDGANSDAGCAIQDNQLICQWGHMTPGETREVHIVSPTSAEPVDDNGTDPGLRQACAIRYSDGRIVRNRWFPVDNETIVTTREKLSDRDGDDLRVTCQSPALAASKSPVVTWRYKATNEGSVDLNNVTVRGGDNVAVDCGGKTHLLPSEAVECSATADSRYINNVSSASATTQIPTQPVAQDWHTVHGRADIDLDIVINGAIAEIPPGVWTSAGGELTIEYRLTNRGNVALTGLSLEQGEGAAIACSLPETLAPRETWMGCRLNAQAAAGPARITATAKSAQASEREVGYYVGYASVSGQ